jgi:phosphate transport system permease protein
MSLVTPTARSAALLDVRERLTRRDRRFGGLALQIVLLATVSGTLLILFTLLLRIIVDAVPLLSARGTTFLTATLGSDPDRVGIGPGLYGSFVIGVGVLLLSVPIGVAAAVYLEEYAHPGRWYNRLIMINIRNLAGVPAVIYGVLGLVMFAGWLKPVTNGKTTLAAALTLAVLVLPIVIITASEAIRAVPQGIRDAGYGVGASKWEVNRDHVLPYAAPGILTGTMLSLARALGEAAPLILLGAITGRLPDTGLTERFTGIPMLIYNWSAEADPADAKMSFQNAAAAAGLVLLVMVLAFNVVAIVLRTRYERKRLGT